MFKILLGLINIIAGLGIAISAITGSVLDATEYPRLVIATMSFPLWGLTIIPLLVLDFFWARRWCIWMAVCTSVALPMVFNVFPLNIPRGDLPTRFEDEAWTLMSYNVMSFHDLTDTYSGDRNPTIDYILEQDADVVVMEEAGALRNNPDTDINDTTLAAVNAQYPYVLVGKDITMLSKFPTRVIPFSTFPDQIYMGIKPGSLVGAYAVNIHGKRIAIVGVHLSSLSLLEDDKEMFEDFTKGIGINKNDLEELKQGILDKIAYANGVRAKHTRALVEEIKRLGYEDVIVCGDFNDTPGSYPLGCLRKIGFTEVYPLVGNGYMNTFHDDMMLVQIDHVLFKGDLLPWSMKRDKVPMSDHYPLITTFIPRR